MDFVLVIANDMEVDVPVRSATISLKKHRRLWPAKTIHTVPVHPPGTSAPGSGSRPLELTVPKLSPTESIHCLAQDDTRLQGESLVGTHSIWLTLNTIGRSTSVSKRIGKTVVNPWDLPSIP